jgi:TPR repeat protein
MQLRTLFSCLCCAFLSVANAGDLDQARSAVDRGDFSKAIELLSSLAEAGDVDALGNLGNMHAFGQGVPPDLAKAAFYWSKAADLGLGTAMGNLGQLALLGHGGIPKDEKLAFDWFRRAAEHRHAPSMIRISGYYFSGVVVAEDRIRALAWAGLAAANAKVPQLRAAAERQAREIGSQMTASQIEEAQRASEALRREINANAQKYKERPKAQQLVPADAATPPR